MAKFEDKHATMDAICLRIAGGDSLNYICGTPPFPTRETVYAWMGEDRALSDKYARACGVRAEGYVEDMIRIADSAQDPVKARLQIDTRKWIASKMIPKKYGDKVDVTTGGDKITLSINVPPLAP